MRVYRVPTCSVKREIIVVTNYIIVCPNCKTVLLGLAYYRSSEISSTQSMFAAAFWPLNFIKKVVEVTDMEVVDVP